MIGLSFRSWFRLREPGFHWYSLDHIKRNVRDGVGEKRKRSDSSDSDSVAPMTPLMTPIFDFL